MTDTEMLRERLKDSGYKMYFIAEHLGLSYQGFLNKVDGKTEFVAPEIKKLCELLNIGLEDKEKIFFAD